MKKIQLFMITLMCCLSVMVYGQQPGDSLLSLSTCVQLGYANNLKLKQLQMETRKGHFAIKEAKSFGFPQISSFASFDDYLDIPVTMVSGEILGQPGTMVPIQLGTKYNTSAGIQVGQMIYDASYFASVRLTRKACEISNLNLEQNKEELAYAIVQMYLLIQVTGHQLALIDSNLLAFHRIYDYSEQHFKNGLIRKADLDRVTVAINNLETERDNLSSARNQQINMLKYVTGIEQTRNIALSDDLATIHFSNKPSDTTFRNHIEMRIMEQKKELAVINKALAQAGNIPSLTACAAFNYQAPTEKFGDMDREENWYRTSYVGFRLTIPIFEGNRIRSKVNQSRVELDQLTTGQEDLRNELAVKLMNASEKLNTNRAVEVRSRINKDLAGHVFTITNQQYGQGLKPLIDVLNAQSEYNIAYISWLNAMMQIKSSELEMAKINGTINNLFSNQ